MINSILTVIELGFKNQQPEVKKAAYKSWQALIDNFSLDLGMSVCVCLNEVRRPFLCFFKKENYYKNEGIFHCIEKYVNFHNKSKIGQVVS